MEFMMEVHYYIRSTSPQDNRLQAIRSRQKVQYSFSPMIIRFTVLEYSVSYLDSEKKDKEIFSIEIEYGHEPAR